MFPRMTGSLAIAPSRTITRRSPLGRYNPKAFGAPSRWRFRRDRRTSYLARLPGPPDDWAGATIESLIALEWSALKAEAENTLAGDREGREHRRLYQRLLDDFERGLAKTAAAQHPRTITEFYASREAAAKEAAHE